VLTKECMQSKTLGAGHHTLWEVLKKYLKGTPKYSSIIIDRYFGSIELHKDNNSELVFK
jgi:hypothetical protein